MSFNRFPKITHSVVHHGVWITVSWFSDIVNVAIHRSTSAAARNVSNGEAIISHRWHSDKSGARALWKWKPIDLVRYVLLSFVCVAYFHISHLWTMMRACVWFGVKVLIKTFYSILFHALQTHQPAEQPLHTKTQQIAAIGLIYGFKGLILVFGLFLAYETRSIKVKQINDSRYVGMSIYNVVVLCLITAPVAMVIASQQDASFVFMALAVIFCCFLSMLLIFVPKVCIFLIAFNLFIYFL